ncbi:heat shock protein transcriptional repressor HspR [Mycetocola reblochoni]|uniref:HspR, transcriptional repressor of DnaK operon n=2 Tax=Mycetocola reblochoni TaxID=331618 RepID=A0A1R4K852_9MICO|nr:MerR family transcriptional regulator [Mycetocola reblochoni]RLP67822.1 MerR family transcriptional regulator [Mycetocola reblochoni]SJN40466.1 HspR, transcriptional repressor of DnaK operon [Mycetocola reblochoni REB411]
MDENSPVFAIATAAELSGLHPQTLRQYDRLGLVSPTRTRGQSRRYSMHNIAQLREIAGLRAEGVNLEGIARILALTERVSGLERQVRKLEHNLANEVMTRRGRRIFAAGSRGDVVSLTSGRRTQRRAELMVWRPQSED